MSTKPASSVPPMAPIVLAAYSSPSRVPASSRVRTRWRVRTGSVMPIRKIADAPERERQAEAEGGDAELEGAVAPQRPCDAVGQAPAGQAAEPEAGQEGGDDGGHGLGRVPEHEHQLARPHHLVDEAGRTRG